MGTRSRDEPVVRLATRSEGGAEREDNGEVQFSIGARGRTESRAKNQIRRSHT